jgi:carboxymethylenebutenolidase
MVAPMGEMIEFQSNGGTCPGYLTTPASGSGPGVVIIQEWWGLVPHIRDVADRFAKEGFVALAPDLYHGKAASEPDEAGKYMMALNMAQAAKDMGGAVDEVAKRGSTAGVGVVGFCMGGGLTLVLACQRPDKVKAACPFYGVIPWAEAQPDWSKLEAAVEGHCAAERRVARPRRWPSFEQAEEPRQGRRDVRVPRHRPRVLQRRASGGVQRGGESPRVLAHHRASSGSSALSKPKPLGQLARARYREQA